jgi:hypothetical protein
MRALLITFAILSIGTSALAQEEDGEEGPGDPVCQLSTNWRVVGNEIGDDPGMIINVNKRDATGQPDCKTKDVTPDFIVGGPDQALWLTSLTSDYLVMTQSTGPIGKIVIQNLTDKTNVVDVVSNDSQADSWGVTYWEQKETAAAENCPQFAEFKAQGFTAVIAHEKRYDFASRTILASGKTSCEPQQ